MIERNPTDLLREEHAGVLKKLDELERIITRPDKKRETMEELRSLAAFFQSEFWVHFAKEENALFPEMEKFMPRDMGPIGVMLAEHEDLRATNGELQKAIQAYFTDPGSAPAGSQMKKFGFHFTTVLRDHIGKEDSILFGMADMHLDPEQKSTVARLFQQIEEEQGIATKLS